MIKHFIKQLFIDLNASVSGISGVFHKFPFSVKPPLILLTDFSEEPKCAHDFECCVINITLKILSPDESSESLLHLQHSIENALKNLNGDSSNFIVLNKKHISSKIKHDGEKRMWECEIKFQYTTEWLN